MSNPYLDDPVKFVAVQLHGIRHTWSKDQLCPDCELRAHKMFSRSPSTVGPSKHRDPGTQYKLPAVQTEDRTQVIKSE
jgi:hypothetical protein